MIILVGVTVNVALNGGLFETTEQAAKETQIEADREILQVGLAGAMVSDTGITNESLQNNLPEGWSVEGEGPFAVTSPKGNVFTVNKNGEITIEGEEPEDPNPPVALPEGWTETTKPDEWDNDRIVAVEDKDGNKIPLPDGYEISDNPEENTIENGVVIKDGANEFVWIPITEEFEETYSGDTNYSEPKALSSTHDSQDTLNKYYGTKEDGSTPYYDYATDFAYDTHYAEMVESVNKYNGFYIGRYETTIDENNEIGSIENSTVLTSDKNIPQTNNESVRWYGLYYVERNNNMTGNGEYLQTNMIWGQQWDKMIEYFDSKSIDYVAFGKTSQGAEVNSGQSTNGSNENDKIYNIYDLRTNCFEWTAEAGSTSYRTIRGGYYNSSYSASYRGSGSPTNNVDSYFSSRLTLYIK